MDRRRTVDQKAHLKGKNGNGLHVLSMMKGVVYNLH